MSEINYKILLLFLVLHRLIMQQEHVVLTEEFQSLEALITEKLADYQQTLGHKLDVSRRQGAGSGKQCTDGNLRPNQFRPRSLSLSHRFRAAHFRAGVTSGTTELYTPRLS